VYLFCKQSPNVSCCSSHVFHLCCCYSSGVPCFNSPSFTAIKQQWEGQCIVLYNFILAALFLRKIPGTHCTGGWVGLGAGLDRSGKSYFTVVWTAPAEILNEVLLLQVVICCLHKHFACLCWTSVIHMFTVCCRGMMLDVMCVLVEKRPVGNFTFIKTVMYGLVLVCASHCVTQNLCVKNFLWSEEWHN
jgi:hypothetical protein